MFVVSFFPFFFLQYTNISNDILHGVTSGFIFSTDQSEMSLLNLEVCKKKKYMETSVDWSIYLIIT